MVDFDTDTGDICDIVIDEFGDYLFELMARSRGARGDTPIAVKKEIGVFIYKDEKEWDKTREVEGDSFSIEGDDIAKIDDEVPDTAQEKYLVHTHPSEVEWFSPHDIASFANAIEEDDGTILIEEGDNIIVSAIEKTDPNVERGTIIEFKGHEWALVNAVLNELERVNTGVISAHEGRRNMIDILRPFIETCKGRIER
jgi:hypothetical protein